MTQTYEAWRITYQSSEQAARAAFERMMELEQGKCLHQIAEPATVQAAPSEVMGALRALHDSVELAIQRGALSERALEIIIMQPSTDVLMRAAAPQAVRAEVATGPCGQCKDTRQPCSCMIDTMLKERGLVAVDAAHYDKISARAKSAPAHPAEGVPAQQGMPLRDLALGVTSFLDHAGFDTSHLPSGMGAALRRLRDAAIATQPAAQGMEKDAERYRMIRDRAEFLDNAKHCIFERDGWEIHGLLHGNDLDMVIDAALAAQAKQGGA